MAQVTGGKIEVHKGLGTNYLQYGEKLTPRDLVDITMVNTEAYKEMEIAKRNHTISQIFGLPGGFLVGFPLGTAIAGGDPEWVLAGIGAGLIVISIPFSAAYNRHAQKAVSIYNEGLNKQSLNKINFNLGFTGTGIGLQATF